MTRIIAGRHGSRRILVPDGTRTRPTSDRVRESLFAAIEARIDLAGARVLDLFAGSGAVGLEAVSRGAASATLVEQDARALAVIRRNVAALGEAGRVEVVRSSVAAFVERGRLERPVERPYDLVFADPPYRLDTQGWLPALLSPGWLAPEALVVVERGAHGAGVDWPEGLEPTKVRRVGEALLHFARPAA